jgi:hypothetical protein
VEGGPCGDIDFYAVAKPGIDAVDGVRLLFFDTVDTSEEKGLALGYGGRFCVLPAVIDSHGVCDPGCGAQGTGGEYVRFRVEGKPPTKAVARYVTWTTKGAWPTPMVTLDDGGYGPRPGSSTEYSKHEVTCTLGTTVECKDVVVDHLEVKPMEEPRVPSAW